MATQPFDTSIVASDASDSPEERGVEAAPLSVTVARGNIYLSREICASCLPGIEAVALLDRDDQVRVVPLTPQSGGGLLLKIRNLRGDRVIHAQEFFREKGYLEDFEERRFAAEWNADWASLVIADLPKAVPKA